MAEVTQGFSAMDSEGRKVLQAEILRNIVMFNNIRIRCPTDGTEHEVPATTKKFLCPISQEVLIIGDA